MRQRETEKTSAERLRRTTSRQTLHMQERFAAARRAPSFLICVSSDLASGALVAASSKSVSSTSACSNAPETARGTQKTYQGYNMFVPADMCMFVPGLSQSPACGHLGCVTALGCATAHREAWELRVADCVLVWCLQGRRETKALRPLAKLGGEERGKSEERGAMSDERGKSEQREAGGEQTKGEE